MAINFLDVVFMEIFYRLRVVVIRKQCGERSYSRWGNSAVGGALEGKKMETEI